MLLEIDPGFAYRFLVVLCAVWIVPTLFACVVEMSLPNNWSDECGNLVFWITTTGTVVLTFLVVLAGFGSGMITITGDF